MEVKKFQRKIENFSCENCGAQIKGSGYTNHCPLCLWSKHVDINPGDRLNTCRGLMQPIEVQTKDGNYIILHHCQRCGFVKRNKTVEDDDMGAIIKLAANN
jgi:hypothetical protein